MQRQSKIIIVLLAISLIFNVYTMSKLNGLRELIAHDFEFYSERVYGEDIDEIRDAIDEIRQEQQWLSKVEIKYGGVVDDEQIVKLSWQVKDYTAGSEVDLYCRESGKDDFRQFPAVSGSAGNFEAELKIKKENQPQWIISHQYGKEDYKISDSVETKDISRYEYEYYIVLNNGTRILSSEVKNINLRKIVQEYSSIEAEIKIDESKPSSVVLYWDKQAVQPDEIVLEMYENNKFVEEVLKKDEEGTAEWKSGGKSFSKLTVRVKYENGKTFKKEIWDGNNLTI